MFWVYLVDNCDHAGVWRSNWPLVEFYIPGFEFKLRVFEDRVVKISDEKWLIKKFVNFQYGDLNPNNRVHASVISILSKEGACKGLARGLQGAKDKDKDKDSQGEGKQKPTKGNVRGDVLLTK
mgnify:FL=1